MWDKLVPKFYQWFINFQSDVFKSCLLLSSRESLGISGRYYNNSLENNHKMQKKTLKELLSGCQSHDVEKVSKALEKWVEDTYLQEIILALRGFGNYRLAPGYEHMRVTPGIWNKLSPESRRKKIEKFFDFIPKPSSTYIKPSNAGKKNNTVTKRRTNQPEAELYTNRIMPAKIPKLTISKTQSSWNINTSTTKQSDLFDPDKSTEKGMTLVLRSNFKECPKSVKRCESCRYSFGEVDVVIVKTSGFRQFSKDGVLTKQIGNVYLHYMTNCHKEFTPNFEFNSIVITKATQAGLADENLARLASKGCLME